MQTEELGLAHGSLTQTLERTTPQKDGVPASSFRTAGKIAPADLHVNLISAERPQPPDPNSETSDLALLCPRGH